MPNPEEIAIIQGLHAGGIERRRFENLLWQRFSYFIHWGIAKYHLPKDEVRQAYNDAILNVIINIVTGRYKEQPNVLLKTYTETIFYRRCIDHTQQGGKNASTPNPKNQVFLKNSFLEMLPGSVKNAIEEIIQREDQLKIKTCLAQLGENCKKILQLSGIGYKDKEIADFMQYSSADVVKQSRRRCLEKLSRYYIHRYKYEWYTQPYWPLLQGYAFF